MTKLECFNIRLFEVKGDNGDVLLDNNLFSKKVFEILSENCLHSNPITIAADPFLFVHNGELFLFYEELRFCTKGVIKMVKTKDLKTWSHPITVLEESFHLSYPYVFEDAGVVYMMPETSAVGEVRLYKAQNEGLTGFAFERTLIKNENRINKDDIDFSDSSVYRQNGLYYLMTTQRIGSTYTLSLYVSENLFGPYLVHSMSPVCKSNKFGRNAGCLLKLDNKLYRVAQDCVNRYGDNVHLLEIKKMTECHYEEQLVKENLYNNSTYHKEGGHQFNMAYFLGKTIIATDSKEYKNYWLFRVVTKLFRLLHLNFLS